jgi:hypothetical protein
MKNKVLRFALIVSGLALALYLAVTGGSRQGWFAGPSYSEEIVLFLTVSHLALYHVIIRRIEDRAEDFVKIYLGSTVLRILFFGLFIFLLLRFDPESGPSNALFFLLCYFLFTALEVGMLYMDLNNRKPPFKGQKEG